MKVYFDNAATTPLRKEVISAMTEVMSSCFGNPSSNHSFGRTAKSYLETARKGIAKLIGAEPQEIIFTSGGTESDNMILHCAVKDLGVKTIITSPIEHHAILHSIEALQHNKKINIQFIKVNEKGVINMSHLASLLQADNSKKLLTLMHVNNEIGNTIDLQEIGQMCHENNALFHTDAVQGVCHYTYNLASLPLDFLSAAAHKFHGPKGIGFSFVRKNSGLQPFIYGGSQERGLRAGTESIHNIVGMYTALQIGYQNLVVEQNYIEGLKVYFIEQIKLLFPKVHFNGNSDSMHHATYTLVNVSLPISKEKAQLLDFHLDLKGIACSKGSACQSGSTSGSHVLNCIQKGEISEWPSLRFSFSIFNTRKEIDYLVSVLKDFLD
ncbi:MAG: cysteine desulfurase family protein [Flavobacteriaceae bacterium]|jgi:cysteine desulfurase